MKRCPFCAEEIQDAAIFYRYCNRDLPKTETVQHTQHTLGSEGERTRASSARVIVGTDQPDTEPWKTRDKILLSLAGIIAMAAIMYLGINSIPEKKIKAESSVSIESKYHALADLDSKGLAACSDFKKLRTQGEKYLALNMVNMGANAGNSSNDKLSKAGKVIAQYILCDQDPRIADCRHISKTEMLQALADIETVCAASR